MNFKRIVRQKTDDDLTNNTFYYMTILFSDWKSDIAHLSTVQTGEYINLLVAAWRHGGLLPADIKQLHALSRTDRSLRIFKEDIEPILQNFVLDGDKLEAPSVRSEYNKAAQKHQVNVERGRKGGLAGRNGYKAEEVIPMAQPSAGPPPPPTAEPKAKASKPVPTGAISSVLD